MDHIRDASISLIIIAYNSLAYLRKLLPTVESKNNLEILIIDNNSTDETRVAIKREYPQVRLIHNEANAGYAKAVNEGVQNSSGDLLIVSNADVEYQKESIDALTAYLREDPRAGVVGPQQVFPDRTWQRSYGVIPGIREGLSNLFGITSLSTGVRRLLWPRFKVDNHPKEVGYIDGAVMAFRRDAFNSVDGFDENFFFYGEEADFCLRLKKSGWKVMFLPAVLVMHVRGGNSRNTEEINPKYSEMLVESKVRLVLKHTSSARTIVYCYLQMFHAMMMRLMNKLMTVIRDDHAKAARSRKAVLLDILVRTWKEKINKLK